MSAREERTERIFSSKNVHQKEVIVPASVRCSGKAPSPTTYVLGLIRATALRYGTTPKEVLGRSRSKLVVAARYECIQRAAQETGASSTQLGRWFGRDHTTILYALGRRD